MRDPHRWTSAEPKREPTSALAVAILLVLMAAPRLLAAGPIFLDGFEICGASAWSVATGLPDCSPDLACPAQTPGKSCVAGRIFDIETSAPLCTAPVSTETCTASSQGGACALEIQVYDALDFLANPAGAVPVAADESIVDGCGRFRWSGFPTPALGFGAIAIDDAADAGDAQALAADVLPVPNQARIEHLHVFAVRHSTDEAWTTTAGSPFGSDTFVSRGVFAPIFLHAGVPVAGVTSTTNGSTTPSSDYYFSDADPTRRSVVEPSQNSTGADGSALIADNTLVTRSGTGNEPPGCTWASILGGSAPDLAVVIEIPAVVISQPNTACP